MTYAILAFILLATAALLGLARMILVIGELQRACPQTGSAAYATAVTVATGFCAIGGGGVLLIAAGMPLLERQPVIAFFIALGFAILCLGLGFSHAANTVRLMLKQAREATA